MNDSKLKKRTTNQQNAPKGEDGAMDGEGSAECEEGYGQKMRRKLADRRTKEVGTLQSSDGGKQG